MADPNDVLRNALTLTPDHKAALIDTLLSGLDKPDEHIEGLWAREAESWIDAYEQGRIKAVALRRCLRSIGRVRRENPLPGNRRDRAGRSHPAIT